MARLYPLVILIQIFCVYHAYSNKSEQKWFWIIIFFPIIGSLIYLYDQFYNRRNINTIKETVKETFVSNYTIDKLEQKVKFSETYANKMELATEHLNIGNIDRALGLFESCLDGVGNSDHHLKMMLIQAHYKKEEYRDVIKYGDALTGVKEFKNSQEMSLYAWANYKGGNTQEAKGIFMQMDSAHCNYEPRLEYCYFLLESEGAEDARDKAYELIKEIEAMDSYERKINKVISKEIKQFYRQF